MADVDHQDRQAWPQSDAGVIDDRPTRPGIALPEIGEIVNTMLADVPEGAELGEIDSALVDYGIRASVCVLDIHGGRQYAAEAMRLGATVQQLHEVLVLVSGLGVHTLMEATRDLVGLADDENDHSLPEIDLAEDELWATRVGRSRYWEQFENHVPGFLHALRRVSPSAFDGFFEIGALPTATDLLRTKTRELISIAVDCLPGHRYLPGVRLHVAGALRFGAGRREILRVIELASQAPEPPGVRGKTTSDQPSARGHRSRDRMHEPRRRGTL